MSGPLHGVRVLDLTTVVMGPYATQILGDFGADVIKVEPPGGDVMRYAWPFRNPGMGSIFLNTNRNKRSIVLDLKQPAAHAACLILARKSDVLVYNTRPQSMARLHLSYEDVRAVNERIIYAGCFGYSQRGPYAAKAAYDEIIQGAAGIPWLLKRQGASEPRYAPMIIADRSVGQQVASAVSAALYHREKTGKGQRIDVPMFEHLLQMILGDHLGGHTFEPQHGEAGYHRILAPDRRPYETKDGYVCALIYNDRHWKAFFEIIGKPEMMQSEKFADHETRSKHYAEVYAFVAAALKKRPTAEWIEALRARRHPGAAHEQHRRHRRRPAPRGDRLPPRGRAPERGAPEVARSAFGVVGVSARVPAPRAAARRAHARSPARSGTCARRDQRADRERRRARRRLNAVACATREPPTPRSASHTPAPATSCPACRS